MQTTYVKSAAKTDKCYIVISARINEDGQIKFQGIGNTINREYGVSDHCDTECLPQLAAFLKANKA
jgi:hypothetical protein